MDKCQSNKKSCHPQKLDENHTSEKKSIFLPRLANLGLFTTQQSVIKGRYKILYMRNAFIFRIGTILPKNKSHQLKSKNAIKCDYKPKNFKVHM